MNKFRKPKLTHFKKYQQGPISTVYRHEPKYCEINCSLFFLTLLANVDFVLKFYSIDLVIGYFSPLTNVNSNLSSGLTTVLSYWVTPPLGILLVNGSEMDYYNS